MSSHCYVRPKCPLYTNKINIYESNCFISLPDWRNCPATSCIYLAPTIVNPPIGSYTTSYTSPAPVTINYPSIRNKSTACGPCGR